MDSGVFSQVYVMGASGRSLQIVTERLPCYFRWWLVDSYHALQMLRNHGQEYGTSYIKIISTRFFKKLGVHKCDIWHQCTIIIIQFITLMISNVQYFTQAWLYNTRILQSWYIVLILIHRVLASTHRPLTHFMHRLASAVGQAARAAKDRIFPPFVI